MTKDLKQTILDQSHKTLVSEGVGAIRMRDLAKSCGCAVGTLYNVFETFDEIHFHLNVHTFKKLFKRLFETLKSAEVPLEDILPKIGWEYIAFAKENTHSFKALFEYAPEGEQPVWYREVVNEHFQKAEEFLEKTYEISKEKAEALISYFWFAIHGVSSIVLNRKATNHSDEFVQSYVDHCLRGIYKLI
ncbi:MAG: TetR/AcrR family transcriptional regulator [Simkaniaceae bacterium]|nr:TetR/AcrR family transcriptional regulator [Candidatus Sacchlamyda saccharinae]